MRALSDVPNAADVISHVLTIIEGHTGVAFKGKNDSLHQSTPDSNSKKYHLTWTSDDVPIKQGSGPLALVAKSVRVQIGFHAKCGAGRGDSETTRLGSEPVTRTNRLHDVNVVLILTRHDGNDVPQLRTLVFRGHDFFHFQD